MVPVGLLLLVPLLLGLRFWLLAFGFRIDRPISSLTNSQHLRLRCAPEQEQVSAIGIRQSACSPPLSSSRSRSAG